MATLRQSLVTRAIVVRPGKAFVGLAVLVLLAMVALAYREWMQYNLARNAGLRLVSVQGSIESLLSNLLDAERGQLAFLLTGEERYLEPHNRAMRLVPTDLANLKRLLNQPG